MAMKHLFDPGYGQQPFKALCENYPDDSIYPAQDFRVEWGPIFHRGRLDGSARVLVIGQDPATHEAVARRILVGEAGQRFQGFLGKLGIDHSYVMVNSFLYSVYGQQGGEKHKNDPGIADYRNQWLNAIFSGGQVQGVVALGALAENAWRLWKATTAGAATNVPFVRITHPTQPDSSSGGDPAKLKAAIKAMLANWNAGLQALRPAILNPDVQRPLVLYGTAFKPAELAAIPEFDFPAGLPEWMHSRENWATRTGASAKAKRATITVQVPAKFMP